MQSNHTLAWHSRQVAIQRFCLHQEGGANSAAPLRFVKVPKGALRPKTGAASSRAESNSPGRIGRFVAQSSDLQCSTGKQTGSGTPTTPGQKTPARAAPNSPAIPAGSSVDAVKEQHHKALVFCRCCYCMSELQYPSPTYLLFAAEIWVPSHNDMGPDSLLKYWNCSAVSHASRPRYS